MESTSTSTGTEARSGSGAHRRAASETIPRRSRRRWISVFIATFVSLQLLLPLRYYVFTSGDDVRDERFAWRMFSSVGMHEHRIAVIETVEVNGETVERQVSSPILDTWSAPIVDRPATARRFLQWWSKRPGVKAVEVRILSVAPDGTEAEPVVIGVVGEASASASASDAPAGGSEAR